MKKFGVILVAATLILLPLFIIASDAEENGLNNAINLSKVTEPDEKDLNDTGFSSCQICNESKTLSATSNETSSMKPMSWTIPPSILDTKSVRGMGEVLNFSGYAPKDAPTSMGSELLEAQNRYRAEVGISPMVWSDTLASGSQQWANYLASINQLVHSSGYYGENLAAQCPFNYYTYAQLVDNTWGTEKQYFKCGTFPYVSTTGNWADVGHYTQMIWPNTQQCGCGYAISSTNCGYLVCRYSPPGNFIGQYICPASSWSSLGGYVTSSPSVVVDNLGKTETWVKGRDNSLWFNIDGTWHGAGGVLTSDPFAVKDYNGKTHVLVRGSDYSIWDFIYDPVASTGHWKGLGGYVTSGPTGAMEPTYHNFLKVAAKGGDNALWQCDLNINTETTNWYTNGGILTSGPYVIFDPAGRQHTFVRGGDNALWDCEGVLGSDALYHWTWSGLGGSLSSGPIACIEPTRAEYVAVFARGNDNALWMNSVYSATQPETGTWNRLGGILTSDPVAVADTSANKIHVFARGSDSALWENIFSTSPWNPSGNRWQGIGGSILTHTPGASIGSDTKAFVIGTDHALWRNTHTTFSATSSGGNSSQEQEEPNIVNYPAGDANSGGGKS